MTIRQTLDLLLSAQPYPLIQHSGRGLQLGVAAQTSWTLRNKAKKMENTPSDM